MGLIPESLSEDRNTMSARSNAEIVTAQISQLRALRLRPGFLLLQFFSPENLSELMASPASYGDTDLLKYTKLNFPWTSNTMTLRG